MEKERMQAKLRKCLALANDMRGDATTRETATRQAAVLMAQLENAVAAEIPKQSDAAWGPYWRQRTSAEAQRAGVRSSVLCRDGWWVPG